MLPTIICHHCGKVVIRNPRLKKRQKYCSEKECQQSRRRNWKKTQYLNNKEYREKNQEHQRKWRKNFPCDRYQRDYRASHPEYVKDNLIKQRARNKMTGKVPHRVIVKANALVIQPRDDGAYTLSRIKHDIIVNRNSLSMQPGINGAFTLLEIKSKKIVNRNALFAPSQ